MTMNRPLMVSALGVTVLLAGGLVAQPESRGGGRGQGFSADQFIDRLMQSDSNGDGKLSRDEMPARLSDQIFGSSDKNGDELLDRDELRAFAEERLAGRGGARGGGGGAQGGFTGQMRRLGDAVGALDESTMTAETRADDLRQIGIIQAALVAAKTRSEGVEMSSPAKDKYGDNVEAYRRDFRLDLIESLEDALAIERAILEGDAESARKHLSAMLDESMEAHSVFQDDI